MTEKKMLDLVLAISLREAEWDSSTVAERVAMIAAELAKLNPKLPKVLQVLFAAGVFDWTKAVRYMMKQWRDFRKLVEKGAAKP